MDLEREVPDHRQLCLPGLSAASDFQQTSSSTAQFYLGAVVSLFLGKE